MNSELRNRALEARLVGDWKCAGDGEQYDYTFRPNNEFTCLVTRSGEEPFKVYGYWDVLGEQLRIGPSPLANAAARIVHFEADRFETDHSGKLLQYQRQNH